LLHAQKKSKNIISQVKDLAHSELWEKFSHFNVLLPL
jgi:hypothetical protein